MTIRHRTLTLLMLGSIVVALAITTYAVRARLASAPYVARLFGSTAQSAAAAPSPNGSTAAPPSGGSPTSGSAAAGSRIGTPRAEVSIDPRRQQLIGVRTVPVTRGRIDQGFRTVGVVRYDETRLVDVNLKVEGWIRDLYVDYTGQPVRRGQPLFTLYSPELLTTENEYLLALKTRDQLQQSQIPDARQHADQLVSSARQRLALWDLPPEQIRALEENREPQTAVVFRSPAGGYVIEKQALQGQHVVPGQSLYKIADLSGVWVEADVYENELPLVRVGGRALVTLDAYPGEQFSGRVLYIYPYVNEQTRTNKVRYQFANRRGRLKPGMYANVELTAGSSVGLVVPTNAVLDSGMEQVVFVAQGEGYFDPRRVKVGRRLGDQVQILEGVKEGEEVATGATFFLDSESQLRASLQAYEPAPATTTAAEPRGRLDIVLRTEPDPPKAGRNQFEISVKDPSGKPLDGAQVSLQFFMAAMPTMSMPAMRNEVKLSPAGGGTYRGTGEIMMVGRWDATVTVSRNGQRVGSKAIAVVAR